MAAPETTSPATATPGPATPEAAFPWPETVDRHQTGTRSALRRFRHRIVTPQAIYGTLLVSAIIGTAEDGESDAEILLTAASTMLVFWIAHVFADGIAHYGATSAQGEPMHVSLKHSISLASGLLYAAIIPLGSLALGALGVVDEASAYAISLLLPVVILGALGWLALADRGSSVWVRFIGSIITALMGLFVILLKIVFH